MSAVGMAGGRNGPCAGCLPDRVPQCGPACFLTLVGSSLPPGAAFWQLQARHLPLLLCLPLPPFPFLSLVCPRKENALVLSRIIRIPLLEVGEQERRETCQGDAVPEPGTGPLDRRKLKILLTSVVSVPPMPQLPSPYTRGCSSPHRSTAGLSS